MPKLVLFVIKKDTTDEKMGVIGLRWNQPSSYIVEIGIILKEQFQRAGFAHQAKKYYLTHMF